LGLKKYKELCTKMGFYSTKEYHIKKYGEELGLKKYKELVLKKINNFSDFSSKIELEFNQSIFNFLNEEQKNKFYGAPITKPFYLNVEKEKYDLVCVVPDIKIGNLVIEFDGTYWHSLSKNKERDCLKNQIYEDHNLILKRVDELEYINNKTKILEETIIFINKNLII
jgi:hypothetical protein